MYCCISFFFYSPESRKKIFALAFRRPKYNGEALTSVLPQKDGMYCIVIHWCGNNITAAAPAAGHTHRHTQTQTTKIHSGTTPKYCTSKIITRGTHFCSAALGIIYLCAPLQSLEQSSAAAPLLAERCECLCSRMTLRLCRACGPAAGSVQQFYTELFLETTLLLRRESKRHITIRGGSRAPCRGCSPAALQRPSHLSLRTAARGVPC